MKEIDLLAHKDGFSSMLLSFAWLGFRGCRRFRVCFAASCCGLIFLKPQRGKLLLQKVAKCWITHSFAIWNENWKINNTVMFFLFFHKTSLVRAVAAERSKMLEFQIQVGWMPLRPRFESRSGLQYQSVKTRNSITAIKIAERLVAWKAA